MASTSRRIKGRDRLVLLATGSEVTAESGTAVYVAAPVATKLAIITQPAGAVDAVAFTTQPVIELQSAASVPVLQAGVTVTASIVAGAGTLIGSVTAVTAGDGRATFSNLGINADSPPASFTLRFASTGLTSVDSSSFTVAASGGPTVLFRSDWSTALGTSEAAIRDTGKVIPWSTYDIGSAQIQTITPAAGLGFPATMANVMRVSYEVADDYNWVVANQLWTLPAVGEARAYRMYFRQANPNEGSMGDWASEHPVETEGGNGGVSGNYSAWNFSSGASGLFTFSLATAKAFPYNYTSWGSAGGGNPAALSKNVTYRIEWKYTRTGTGLYTLECRGYGADDSTLLYTNANVFGWGGGALSSGSNSLNYPMDDARIQSIRIGDNGGITGGAGCYGYYGGFCVATDWCGAYNPATG